MPTESHWPGRVTELTPLVVSTMGTHAVQLYEDDAFLVSTVTRVFDEGLADGDAVVSIATPEHRHAIEARLRACGYDIDELRHSERFMSLDADEALASLLVDGAPDEPRFAATIGVALDIAGRTTTHGRVRVFGEMVASLWSAGEREQALELEAIWNRERLRRPTFSLLCAYPLAVFGTVDDTPRFSAMCGHHTHVTPAESYAELENAGERLRAIAELQQKALVLEGETVRGLRPGLAIVCRRCNRTLLNALGIGHGEGDLIATHLRDAHIGVLPAGPATLGILLREVRLTTAAGC